MRGTLLITVSIVAQVWTLLWSSTAQAGPMLSLGGNYTLGSGPAHTDYERASIGYSLSILDTIGDHFRIGIFGEITPISSAQGSAGKVYFMGTETQVSMGESFPFFVSAKLGATRLGSSSVGSSDFALGYGIGAGYLFNLGSNVSGGPMFSRSALPETRGALSADRTLTRVGILFSYRFSSGPSRTSGMRRR